MMVRMSHPVSNYNDQRPTRAEAERDEDGWRIAMSDTELEAKFGPDFDDVFAPADGNTDDIDIATDWADGRLIPNEACVACQIAPAGNDHYCDDCADALADDFAWEAGRSCSICDAIGHGYPGGGPCPLEDRGYDTDGIWR